MPRWWALPPAGLPTNNPTQRRDSPASAKHETNTPAYNPPVTTPHPKQSCPYCHYDLTGVPIKKQCYKCPECGYITDKNETHDAPWFVTSKNSPGIAIAIPPSAIWITYLIAETSITIKINPIVFGWLILLTTAWYLTAPLIHTLLTLKWNASRFNRGPGFTYIRTLFVSLIAGFIMMLAYLLLTLMILPFL